MAGLLILRPPQALRSGDDVLSSRTIDGLTECGIPAVARELSSQWWAGRLWFSKLPGRRTLFEFGPAFVSLLRHRHRIDDATAVWINGPASPLNKSCWFEHLIVNARKPYIFHLQDDWFSIPALNAVAAPRVRLASLVVVPTEALKARISELFPEARILVLEEPLDIERFKPVGGPQISDPPFLVWTGHVTSMADLNEYAAILERVYLKHRFRLRIISGKKRPHLSVSFPWEWFPFDHEREAEYLSGAALGLAPLEDGAYARCKGGYKVKTYLAAGIPTVASPVGHHTRLIQSGENGILAKDSDEWVSALLALLSDTTLANKLGKAGRDSASAFSHRALMPIWAEKLGAAVPELTTENVR